MFAVPLGAASAADWQSVGFGNSFDGPAAAEAAVGRIEIGLKRFERESSRTDRLSV
jgi:hypothetical protein